MKNPIQSISIEGFKSIRSLRDFPLNPGLNVLIGANGAGKSNFVELFKLLNISSLGGFDEYVARMGGAETFLFQGADNTKEITIKIEIDPPKDGIEENFISPRPSYDFNFFPDVENMLRFKAGFKAGPFLGEPNISGESVGNIFLRETVAAWRIYHFQNTSAFSPLRKVSSVHDHNIYYSDGSNLGAFLWGLKRNHPRIFEKIETSVRQILPAFANFDLTPVQDESQPDNQRVWLYWKQRGSEYRYKPWQFSDGTIRFLALAAALLQPEPPATIIIDEPELGLHPMALSVFAGLMHEAALAGTQLIIATQNSELLNSLDADNIVTVNQINGESRFERLHFENLQEWLEEYTLGDLFTRNVIQAGLNYV